MEPGRGRMGVAVDRTSSSAAQLPGMNLCGDAATLAGRANVNGGRTLEGRACVPASGAVVEWLSDDLALAHLLHARHLMHSFAFFSRTAFIAHSVLAPRKQLSFFSISPSLARRHCRCTIHDRTSGHPSVMAWLANALVGAIVIASASVGASPTPAISFNPSYP